MSDERLKEILWRLHERFGFDFETSQDEAESRHPCPLSAECIEAGDNSLTINLRTKRFACSSCGKSGTLEELAEAPDARPEARDSMPIPATRDPVDATVEPQDVEFSTAPISVERALAPHEPRVLPLGPAQRYVSADEQRRNEKAARKAERRKRGSGERLIIALLALVFLAAGLLAAALSGFANYQAFSGSVADPLQSSVWGWTGVIAAIVSFGGFTFFYWHTTHRRWKEGLRAILFALAGMGTSIFGTGLYISSNNASAQAEVARAASNRDVLEAQIADWRNQLEGIPPETRSVEGLEAYIAEVERVGRTHQKPYRDAQNELGLAKRRDELQARIDAANAELLGTGDQNILVEAQERAEIPSWFFAVMLELFSSQGTSIGLVALLILFGRKPAQPPPETADI